MASERVTIPIYGLGCGGGGSLTIERALAKETGITRVTVNPATEMAYVEYDPAVTRDDQIVAVVRRVGFDTGVPMRR